MQENKSLFITKLRERKNKNGKTYFIGSLGMATIMITQHSKNADEWNLMLMEPLKKENSQQSSGFHSQSGGGYGGPGPDFNTNEDVPF